MKNLEFHHIKVIWNHKIKCGISIISSRTIRSIVVSTSSTSPRCRSSSTMEGWSEAQSTNSTFTSCAHSNIILSWETISSPCCSSKGSFPCTHVRPTLVGACASLSTLGSSVTWMFLHYQYPIINVVFYGGSNNFIVICHPWFPNWFSLSIHLLHLLGKV